jgi:xylose isomerase
MRTQKAAVATKHLSNSRKIFQKLLKISRSLDQKKMNAMISQRDYEALDMYIVERLLDW